MDQPLPPNLDIIAITGKKHHGKSTLTRHLIDQYGYHELSFAGPLKRGLAEIFDFTEEQATNQELKETVDEYWGVTPRQVYQTVGTQLFRDELPRHLPQLQALWIKRLKKSLLKFPPGAKIVISDLRFPDEWRFLESVGAKIYRVIRPGYIANPLLANHASETALDDHDQYPATTISNNHTIEHMLKILDILLFIRPTKLASQPSSL